MKDDLMGVYGLPIIFTVLAILLFMFTEIHHSPYTILFVMMFTGLYQKSYKQSKQDIYKNDTTDETLQELLNQAIREYNTMFYSVEHEAHKAEVSETLKNGQLNKIKHYAICTK